ncbi:MAG TPA: beta-ketoacyl-[acyl-carrier-protein] synthase family protein [Acidocella sp.]|jgi:3-oxoacyl-[acyl-carrier-protein] synthase-1|uniref:beta-ketoacyl-[acyl-carrier-protein] synthase family protein n=1 Tax=Acidocella sp. TaxID=50710 RepID=UPI002B707409|nr:beta-ketoacyl-[acyl-carrier-protein] synthase family protein [Acidocella sp.]HVE22264.1 beta-ketoacyl-[acyl-carrier-protein] synthase family protein [Acidocella sp.]
MSRLALSDFALVTCLGAGRAETLAALRTGRSGLAPCHFDTLPLDAYTGEIQGLEALPLQGEWAGFDCRNNRLAALALAQDGFMDTVAAARARYGATRVGVFVGTSTSGILQTEAAYRHRGADGPLPPSFDYARTHNTYALGHFVRDYLGLKGPAFAVSTACAATSKAFASAARMMAAGLCDAAIVGGADTLCATTLFGFHALGVIAEGPCRPFDIARNGISIGEAAGFVLLERPGAQHDSSTVLLLGTGESSDAYHMSSPHPDGAGARRAMAQALAAADLTPADIDYINLHGTATLAGDAAEDQAISRLFGNTVPCSSSKGFTGHTLGASGIVGAALCALAIQHEFLPGSPHTKQIDPSFGSNYMLDGQPTRISRAISNSFGFGGVNCSLVLGRAS